MGILPVPWRDSNPMPPVQEKGSLVGRSGIWEHRVTGSFSLRTELV